MAIAPQRTAIGIRRQFTTEGVDPYDMVVWERRDARITNYRDGVVAFEQLDVEVPATWSFNATNILAQKYFRGTPGTPEREWSLRQVADRVVDTITAWGRRDGYFEDDDEAAAFRDELKYLIITQRAAFNSPVWFNIGVEGVPQQASACFILSVDDAMDSILNWYREEGIIFKGGSGAGVNLSRIRASMEHLQGGGTASGPVSFMRGADASAGTIKSGGKTRRAAKMVILDVDHPDIEDFVWCKALEERKARVLRDAGFDMDLDGRDAFSIQYQNANNSVRVTDEFMAAVEADGDWSMLSRTTGQPVRTVRARELFRQIAQASWECADPGMQFDSTINRWHTSPNAGRINGSNPCSEYMHIDNSACNLASMNLLTFLGDDGEFDTEAFTAAVATVFTAQEILVGNADYPTEPIADNSRRYRQLGIGYANLGALLMAQGMAYDSDDGRAWAAAITALLTGHAYATSARLAARMGPFAGFHDDAEAMIKVLRMHRAAAANIDEDRVPPALLGAAQQAWDSAVELGEIHGVRNAQASVLAPTGTIGLLMDCDTTGVEPDLGLVKTKKLVGGGTMSIVNQTVPRALARLGYSPEQVEDIVRYIDEHKTIVGAPHLRAEHLPVFACSMGDNTIHYLGHVRMMAAVQPFISGAISKCVVGETLVVTEDGLVRIGALYEGEQPDTVRMERMMVTSLDGPQKTDAFYFGGERPVRRVQLQSGHQLTGTPNHRVLVASDGGLDWRALEDLQPGDEVATKYGDDMWSFLPARIGGFRPSAAHGRQQAVTVPAEMSDALAFFLGAYAAGGSTVRSVWSVRITNPVEAVLQRVTEAAEQVFGVRARVRRPAGRCAFVEINAKTVVELLDRLGCGAGTAAAGIPDAVLRSTRSHVLSFLQGLAADAYVVGGPNARWGISLDSPALLDDVQAVLTNLGVVHARIARRDRATGRGHDEIVASGSQAQAVVRLVPFVDPEKALASDRLLAGTPAPNVTDVVPGLSSADLYQLLPEQWRPAFADLAEQGCRPATRSSLQRVAVVDGVRLPPWLTTVLNDGLHFSPVVACADAGRRTVYDLSVPTTHAFVGNGIVSHNTVNMPEDVTVEDVEQLHLDAWKMGIKAVAIYRDNCKVAQPLATTKKGEGAALGTAPSDGPVPPPASAAEAHVRELGTKIAALEAALRTAEADRPEPVVVGAVRERLPRRRRSSTFAFRVADCEGYVTVGEYDDGRPGEVFMKVSKQGSTLAGIMDAFSISVSLGLQHGVPLETYVRKYTNMRFEPAGITDDPELRIATSLIDYIFRRLAVDYLTREQREGLGVLSTDERLQPTLPGLDEVAVVDQPQIDDGGASHVPPGTVPPVRAPRRTPAMTTPGSAPAVRTEQRDAPLCYQCGMVMQRAGSCYVCSSCGTTSGCS